MVAATASELVIVTSLDNATSESATFRHKDPIYATLGIYVPRSLAKEGFIVDTPATVDAATVKGFNVDFFTTDEVADTVAPVVESKA